MPATLTDTPQRLTCTRCGHTKDASEFYRSSASPTGHRSYCKACRTQQRRTNRVTLPNMTRTVGVEIECRVPGYSKAQVAAQLRRAGLAAQHYDHYFGTQVHATTAHWKVVPDGSVMGGMEVVSPPLAGAEFLRQLKVATRVLNRLHATVAKDCGLHVHLDAGDLDLPAAKRLARLYVKHEGTLDSVMPRSRRESPYYCRSHTQFMDEEQAMRRISNAHSIDGLFNIWGTRYVKLNFRAYEAHGTVEFRHHSGTVAYDKTVNWVAMVISMYEAAKAGKDASATTRPSTLRDLFTTVAAQPVVRKFYTERQAALAAA
jgi:hypothetical protein